MKKYTSIISVFTLLCNLAYAQIMVSNYVIGSVGGQAKNSQYNVSYTVGESVISTLNGQGPVKQLTQGFQQPSVLALYTLNIEIMKVSNATCLTTKDGYAIVNATGGNGSYDYSWFSVNGEAKGTSSRSNFTGQGKYIVIARDVMGNTGRKEVVIGVDHDEDCDLNFYSGFTPNGDGQNDSWEIGGILVYEKNKVYIYNRWGDEVWSISDYNNTDRAWNGKNKSGTDLPEGSYYYIVETEGLSSEKGWVQIIR